MTWRALLEDDFVHNIRRLQVAQVHGDGSTALLMEDGSWVRLEPGTAPDQYGPRVGLPLPRDPEALRAIAEVFHPHATGQARLEGEIARLEEALKLERARVELLIDKALGDR